MNFRKTQFIGIAKRSLTPRNCDFACADARTGACRRQTTL